MQEKRCFSSLCVSNTSLQTPKRIKINEAADTDHERTNLVSTNLTLSLMYQTQNKSPRASIQETISSVGSTLTSNATDNSDELERVVTSNPKEVSTTLCLFDESWNFQKKAVENPTVSCGARKSVRGESRNIRRMRVYTKQDREEERQDGVSTQLKLFSDPWTIKKNLTASDVGHLSRLLLKTSQVKEYILSSLTPEIVLEIENGNGVLVRVWDHDTGSIHKLVFKKWITSGSYVLIDNWVKEFVKRRGLGEGDEIGFFWDRFDLRLHFRVLERAAAGQQ